MSLGMILMSLMSLGVISLWLREQGLSLMTLGVRLMSLGVGLEKELRDEFGGDFDEFDEFGGHFLVFAAKSGCV